MRFLMFLVVLWVWVFQFSTAQDNYLWTRYTTEDGLSQNTVMSILQDQKGFMWFATWYGLSRFDGYNFSSYKIRPGDNVHLTSSRIDNIIEDRYGYIWLLSYGQSAVRFDPITEEFVNVPENPALSISVNRIVSLQGGSTWFISENSGGVRNTIDTLSANIVSQPHSLKSGTIESNVILDVIEDGDGNEWILTDNGLSVIEKGNIETSSFFYESAESIFKSRQAFYCAMDIGNEIWFGSVKGRVWRYLKDGGRFVLLDVPTTSNVISFIQLTESSLLLATADDGFLVYDAFSGLFKHYNERTQRKMSSNRILSTYLDIFGEVWIQQASNSIIQFRPKEGDVVLHEVYSVSKDGGAGPVYMIHEDINGVLWIHPEGGGISWYDRNSGVLRPFFSSNELLRTFSDRLHSMYSDRQGNLWLCTRVKGLDKFVFPKNDFKILEPVKSPLFLSDNDIRAIMEDNRGRLWVATKGARLAIYDADRKLLGFLTKGGKIQAEGEFYDSNVYSMVEDKEGVIWIGTKGEGLIKAVPKDSEGKSYAFTNFRHSGNDLYSLSHDDAYNIHIDNNDRIWIATYGGGINLLQDIGNERIRFISHRNHLSGYPINSCFRTRCIASDASGKILIGTTNGLVVFDGLSYEPESFQYSHYLYTSGDSLCLSNNDVHDILVTRGNDIYLSTFGGGLNKVIQTANDGIYRFKSYTSEKGLPADVLLSVTEDTHGKLWIATENGISRFDPEQETFRNFNKTDFSIVLNFSEGSGALGREGDLYIGSNKGVVSFHPDAIKESSFVPPIIFSEFRLSNRKVTVGQGSVLQKHIDATEELILKHNQNIISFAFAALDMKYPGAVRYAAMLEGFDNEWKYLDDQRWVNYTNLPHGSYILRVRSTNSDGLWVENERALNIYIKPSFWVTPLAYLIYFFLFFLIAGLSVYILFTIYRLRHEVVVEHQIAQMKLDFFTNISHELRTPLTLITGPLEQVLQNGELQDSDRQRLKIVELNSNRMLRLINQILDFVKIGHRKMKMTVKMLSPSEFVSSVMDNFRYHAIEQGVEFTLEDSSGGAKVWADADKLEKIIYNLLSNSFKYLDDGKYVRVITENANDYIELKIIDDGIGIGEGQRKLLFERFDSTLNAGRSIKPSTGIGLALVKELADMHKAEVIVESIVPRGTAFTLRLKKGLSHFGDEVEILDYEHETAFIEGGPYQFPQVSLADSDVVNGDYENTILIVEDNLDVRQFLKGVLKEKYHVIESSNGTDGFEKAEKFQPDLIISDLMMPVKDGLDLLKDIRESATTSHIPFIILSAKSNLEIRLVGLESGADDYISKPFSPNYLMVRIENLLERRKELQKYYQLNKTQLNGKLEVSPDMPELPSLDLRFLNDLRKLMEDNMDNSSLVVDDLVKELGYSRSVFFKKLKVLTGLAPIEFIRDMRLKRAAQLIEDGQYNVTQIAFMVGMNDARYFSRCFKQKYGVTPSGYKRSLRRE